ncbi:MAG: HAMP domain-containing histidine kinase [Phycisphaerae bacterium]|nr:HAMP domain-containing histidine kinase [Phycisphaerae bacterium]
MFGRSTNPGTGRSGRVWPVLAALLATVIIPSACMLWFMDAAMRNEALAVRQRLVQAYGSEAAKAAKRLDPYWAARTEKLILPVGLSPPEAFQHLVRAGLADGFILRDQAGGVVYPVPPSVAAGRVGRVPAGLLAGAALEQDGKAAQAAAVYAAVAAQTSQGDLAAQAAVAQARCLARAGRKDQAIEVLVALMGAEQLAEARDDEGRLIVPGAGLFALQLMGDDRAGGFRAVADRLAAWLNDYAGAAMGSSQRRFLMAALREVDPSAAVLPTLEAEDLAAEVLARGPVEPAPMRLSPSAVAGVHLLAGADGRVIALLRQDRVLTDTRRAFDAEPLAGMRLTLTPPGAAGARGEPFLMQPAGAAMPGWTLRVDLTGGDPFASASQRQRAVYIGTATAGIVAVVLLALSVTFYLGRQVRLTRLKNDLIATVSHELKTPLSSMRLLIDTLLEDRYRDIEQAREYFALISKENERLTRLIDNFLNFSRMERNRRAFVFAPLSVEEILAAVMRAVPDRITHPPGQFELEVADDCPPISGDRDALVTVVLNLLDNAHKYSGDPRRIVLRAWGRNGRLHVSVSDNGIGLSRRAARRVFDRFYQVDRSLSRAAGGCGLGLSIVKFVVEAHGGTVTVASRVGEGSTFTMSLPTLNLLNHRRAAPQGGTDGC